MGLQWLYRSKTALNRRRVTLSGHLSAHLGGPVAAAGVEPQQRTGTRGFP
jgi:hypothetical protein